jgi:hypothetical protein
MQRGNGEKRVLMPLNPAFKSPFAQRSHKQPFNGKVEEEANFSPF